MDFLIDSSQAEHIPFYEKVISPGLIKEGQRIGKGGAGTVKQCSFLKKLNLHNFIIEVDSTYVVKEVSNDIDKMKYILREACISNIAVHPFISNLSAWSIFDNHDTYNPKFISLKGNLGDLRSLIGSKNQNEFIKRLPKKEKDSQNNEFKLSTWSSTEIYKLIYSICRSIWLLHRMNICHRDIKSQNIIVFQNKIPKITDFGSCRMKKQDLTDSATFLSAGYGAPELAYTKTSFPADVFSLAMTLYEILENTLIEDMLKEIGITGYTYINYISSESNRPPFSKAPDNWRDLIQSMWAADPAMRPTMDVVINTIEKEKFFLEGSNVNEILQYINDVKETEKNLYCFQANSTIKKLIHGVDESVNIENDFENNNVPYFMPFFYKSPLNEFIEDYNDDDAYDGKYDVFIHNIFSYSLNEKKNDEIELSMALYYMYDLFDYASAYKILIDLVSHDDINAKTIIDMIKIESEHSLFVKGMIHEAENEFQKAADIYCDCLEQDEISANVLGRLGRIYLYYGENDDIQNQGLKLMMNSSSMGNQFSSFHLGYFFLQKAIKKKRKNESFTNDIELSIKYFHSAPTFHDSNLMLAFSYKIQGDTKMADQYYQKVDLLFCGALDDYFNNFC